MKLNYALNRRQLAVGGLLLGLSVAVIGAKLPGWLLLQISFNSNKQIERLTYFSGSPLFNAVSMNDRDLSLAYAIRRNNNELARSILDSGVPVNAGPDGFPNLTIAAGAGNVDMANELIARGADLFSDQNRGLAYPLYAAVAGNKPEMVRFLISKGCDVNLRPAYLSSSLASFATQHKFYEIAEILKNAGASEEKTKPLRRLSSSSTKFSESSNGQL